MTLRLALALSLGTLASAGAELPPAIAARPARNLFAELIGKSEAQLDARLADEWQQLFYGDDATQRVYYPLPDGTAYIADVASGDVRTEGLSYGMMIAVQLGHRAEFDRLWEFARRYLHHDHGPYRGYFAWHADFSGRPLDTGPAPDGEEWFATALLFASHRWGDGAGSLNYGAQAQEILHTMLHEHEDPARGRATDMFDARTHLAVFAPDVTASTFSDPSYELPAFYELWARWADDPADRAFYAAAATAARADWRRAADPRTGLMPDYANFDGSPHPREYHGNFAYDAWRTLANCGLDWAWWRADPAEQTEANRVLTFLGQFGDHCPNRFALDGTPQSTTSSLGLTAMAAVAGLAADPAIARPWIQRLWDAPIPTSRGRYYDGMLGFLALLEAGGRLQIFSPPPPVAVFNWFEYSGRDERFASPLPDRFLRNPLLAGFYPDPSLCRRGDDYYLVNSSFTYFPGIPIFQSRDLAHWHQLGHVITRRSQAEFGGLGISRGVFAPALSYHEGTFYLVTTLVDCGGNCFFTAQDPAGPWSDPKWLPVDAIDPSFFWDDDGRGWLVNNGPPPGDHPLYDGHRAIWLQEFDAKTARLVGPRRVIVNGGVDLSRHPVWIEAPHLFRRADWYYLICAEGGTAENHSEVVFRARSLTGPWVPGPGNPILTQRDLPPDRPDPVTSTGHADFVVLPDGRTWAVFLGCRPYEGDRYNTGRETFASPVAWRAGWPEILPRGAVVPAQLPAPLPTAGAAGADPLTGNFTWRDNFAGPELAPEWNLIRTPHERWWSFSAFPGALAIEARAVALGDRANPSFVGHRQQHGSFVATTALRFPAAGVVAGLAAFQNETHYFFLGVRRQGPAGEVFLERTAGETAGSAPLVLARRPIALTDSIELRIEARGRPYRFSFRSAGGAWQSLDENEDGSILSTAVAGGFVGTYLGLYAHSER